MAGRSARVAPHLTWATPPRRWSGQRTGFEELVRHVIKRGNLDTLRILFHPAGAHARAALRSQRSGDRPRHGNPAHPSSHRGRKDARGGRGARDDAVGRHGRGFNAVGAQRRAIGLINGVLGSAGLAAYGREPRCRCLGFTVACVPEFTGRAGPGRARFSRGIRDIPHPAAAAGDSHRPEGRGARPAEREAQERGGRTRASWAPIPPRAPLRSSSGRQSLNMF